MHVRVTADIEVFRVAFQQCLHFASNIRTKLVTREHARVRLRTTCEEPPWSRP